MSTHSPLLPVYRRSDIVMVRGEGVYLYDNFGTRYLDFAAGIAVNALGHSHPALVEALRHQAGILWHCSNAYHTPPLDRFAAALVEASGFADHVFFCSSGTEAVECAIKMIRRFQYCSGQRQRTRIIAAEGAFHGRTTGALAACGHAESRAGFEPLLEGFDHVAFNDISALEAAITPETAGILLETIQGEGGIRAHDPAYLQAARNLADRHGLLLCLDEIQCGYGRTGQLFAFEKSGIFPDIVTLAKGIGGGFPLAATLCTAHAAGGMTPGSHGSTYGSNPLACAVGETVLKELTRPGFLSTVLKMGEALCSELVDLTGKYPELYREARGEGLMLGLELAEPSLKVHLAASLREAGLLVAPAVTDVLRILPPLIINQTHITEALDILHSVSKVVAKR